MLGDIEALASISSDTLTPIIALIAVKTIAENPKANALILRVPISELQS